MNKIFEEMKLQAVPDEKTVGRLIDELPRKQPRSRKKLAGIAVTAAALALCSISAAAVISYYHAESVDRFFSADELADDVLFTAVSADNGNFRITIDKIFCDGENVNMIFTVESLNGEPLYEMPPESEFMTSKYSITPEISPDGSFELNAGLHGEGWGASFTDEDMANNVYRFMLHYSAKQQQRDILGETHFRFAEFMYIAENDNPFKDIFLQTNIEKNIDAVTLHSEDGTEALMSQIGFYIKDFAPDDFVKQSGGEEQPTVYYITNEGDKVPTNPNWLGCGPGGVTYTSDHVIDLDDYAGVELFGVQYLK